MDDIMITDFEADYQEGSITYYLTQCAESDIYIYISYSPERTWYQTLVLKDDRPLKSKKQGADKNAQFYTSPVKRPERTTIEVLTEGVMGFVMIPRRQIYCRASGI